MADEYWLISTKNKRESSPGDDSASKESIDELRNAIGDCAEVYNFELPELRVGTLEKLMSSGDLLNKVDVNVESVIRKIERQFQELNDNNEVLTVDGLPTLQYLEQFRWNAAKYPTQRAVDELIRNIVQNANKTEMELKESAAFCTEKKQRVQALQRQKEGNLMSANLNDALTPNVDKEQFHDSEYLKTCVIVVAKSLEKEFLAGYENIGNDIVLYPNQKKGSPVVPGSATKALDDKDGYCIYLVTILKKFYEEFKTSVQSAKFVCRDYDFKESYEAYQKLQLEGDGVDELSRAQLEANESAQQLIYWCKTHYGDAFMAWIHIKAIRLFVESVLRYGLPVNFAAALVKSNKKSLNKKVRDKLFKLYSSLDKSGMMQVHADDGGSAALEEMFPYVSYTIEPHEAE